MAQLKSTQDWTGREVDGVILGEPTRDKDGNYVWDHSALLAGDVDPEGDIYALDERSALIVKVDTVGDWSDVVPSKKDTTALRADEKATGLVKLDRDVKFIDGKLEVSVSAETEIKGAEGEVLDVKSR